MNKAEILTTKKENPCRFNRETSGKTRKGKTFKTVTSDQKFIEQNIQNRRERERYVCKQKSKE